MTVTGVISVVLLVAGLVIVVGSCAGMAVLDDPLDRLHLTTPAAMLGSTGICASTSAVIPASVVVPLGAAALMAGFSRFLPRWARDLIAIAVALATTTLTLILMAASAGHPMIYWFSGWRPSGGMVIGIDCAVGPLGAGIASLAGVLASAALVYCWRYFDSAPAAATTPWS
ncbi:MAG: hypothetical protein ACRDOD_01615 [Streptosporangiaceae bacterium]